MNSNPKICQHCNNAVATVHIKQRINGQETNRELCSACAAKLGFAVGGFSKSLWDMDPFDNLLGSFVSSARSVDAARCPTCGRSLADVKRTGRFGCGECYGIFERRVDLTPFTSPEGYKGKRPPVVGEAPAASQSVPEESVPSRQEQLDRLRQSLKQAVEQEEYEAAAKLRDQLRALEAKEDK